MCELLSELFSIESDFSPDIEKQSAGLKLLLEDSSASLLIAAEADGNLVGMCSVQKLFSTAQGGPVGLLEDLIVSKHYRGSGIAQNSFPKLSNGAEQTSFQGYSCLRIMRTQ